MFVYVAYKTQHVFSPHFFTDKKFYNTFFKKQNKKFYNTFFKKQNKKFYNTFF